LQEFGVRVRTIKNGHIQAHAGRKLDRRVSVEIIFKIWREEKWFEEFSIFGFDFFYIIAHFE